MFRKTGVLSVVIWGIAALAYVVCTHGLSPHIVFVLADDLGVNDLSYSRALHSGIR